MTAIRTFFQEFWNRIPQIGVNDIIDILIDFINELSLELVV